MNELQRQAYLSALGIENYAPRWLLPSAPVPVACVLPVMDIPEQLIDSSSSVIFAGLDQSAQDNKKSPPDLLNSISELVEKKKISAPVNVTTILQQLEEKKAPVVQPFSLSVYRPQPGFLIIDSRNTQLALPTDLFLRNLLLSYLKSNQFSLNDEVLRWPLIENRFVSRTETDARNELQTWLAVESELRPINTLWLMGENASRYWLAADSDWVSACWAVQAIDGLPLKALVLPSLNELLQNPAQKAKLWASLS
ncbi:MAG: hypothetical protein AAGC78_00005 [Cellvibrio sp.]|uniref:hypothetical protein n=1 Tax=Cellvibrio sp. TaxID=1965322 RepID=UPI0031B1D9E0